MQKHRGVKGEGTLREVQVVLYCRGWGGEGKEWRVLWVTVKDFLEALGFQAEE